METDFYHSYLNKMCIKKLKKLKVVKVTSLFIKKIVENCYRNAKICNAI